MTYYHLIAYAPDGSSEWWLVRAVAGTEVEAVGSIFSQIRDTGPMPMICNKSYLH